MLEYNKPYNYVTYDITPGMCVRVCVLPADVAERANAHKCDGVLLTSAVCYTV